MIDIINDVIDDFLIKVFGQDSEGYLKVRSKYTYKTNNIIFFCGLFIIVNF